MKHRNCTKAAQFISGNAENIRMCCNHIKGRKTYYKSIWVYEKDYKDFVYNKYFYDRIQGKLISRFTLDGIFIDQFYSAKYAEEVTGIGRKLISRVCNGTRKQTHGYIFKFADIKN